LDEDHHEENKQADETVNEQALNRNAPRYSNLVFTSKVNKLVALLKHVRDSDPSAKSLVFSQFIFTLQWLQGELPKHGFQYRTLTGDMTMSQRAKALRDFQNDPPTTLFLLSMRAGSVGINLTEANCVFIMEPFLNPALEAQAIGRVHRLGQKRPVEVTRLVMKDSVESRIVQMIEKKYGRANPGEGCVGKQETSNGIGSLKTDKAQVFCRRV